MSVTHVSVYNSIDFADPYKVCNACGGPVDGCKCLSILGHVPHGTP